MIFNSIPFLVFIFLFFPLYYLCKGRLRIFLCLAASYIFYGWWDYRFLALIFFSTVLDYSISNLIGKSDNVKTKKALLAASVVTNLSILGFFKYFNFFVDSAIQMFNSMGFYSSYNLLNIILPVGISFYTFQLMSYSIDVYKGRFQPESDFLVFATYIVFFPQLMAGPIVRAVDFIPQLKKDQPFNIRNFESGLVKVLVGFAKKVVIADSLAVFVDAAFAYPDNYSSLYLILGVFFYSFQIYCDFSGYSDIAIGLARMMGYEFPRNFNMPYFSKSFSEFWERWHITLSSWLRDYLYISLGGNRKGKIKTYRNLMLTMLLGGLWHGANWTFVFWGFLHGSYLVLQRLITSAKESSPIKLPGVINSAVSIAIVYILTCFAWVFFRSPDFQTATKVLNGIFALNDLTFSHLPNKLIILKNLALVGILLFFEVLSLKVNLQDLVLRNPVFRVASFAAILWMIALLGSFIDSQFIYFQF